MSYQEILFKVKKLVINNREVCLGFLAPGITDDGFDFRDSGYDFYGIDGKKMKLDCFLQDEIAFKNTKIMNEELKISMKELIQTVKEECRLLQKIVELKSGVKKVRESKSTLSSHLPTLCGLMSVETFEKKINPSDLTAQNYRAIPQIRHSMVTGVQMKRVITTDCLADRQISNAEFDVLKERYVKQYEAKVVGDSLVSESVSLAISENRMFQLVHVLNITLPKMMELNKPTVDLINQQSFEIVNDIKKIASFKRD